MAIKFVDIEPGDAGKGEQAARPAKRASEPPAMADEPTTERPGVSPLPYAKPAPTTRGRN